MTRLEIRDAFLRYPKQLSVVFYTSSRAKFSQASLIFQLSGARLVFRAHEDDPYHEEYGGSKEDLLVGAVKEIRERGGGSSCFFIEDTSIRIEALSRPHEDYPGLRAKEWFRDASFDDTLSTARKVGDLRCSVESTIALSIPGLQRPALFSGTTAGELVETLPDSSGSLIRPWLDPGSFSGWFIPTGANRTLGEMSLEESFSYDFRALSLLALIDRLEELTTTLNAGAGSYRRRATPSPFRSQNVVQGMLFDDPAESTSGGPEVILVVGPTCAGKTTFGVQATHDRESYLVDASSIVRRHRTEADIERPIGDFAAEILAREGFDMVGREVTDRFAHVGKSLVVTGLRTIEEVEHIREIWPRTRLVSLRTPQRVRYQRYVERASREDLTFTEFRERDEQQASFGLLPVADDLADVVVDNVGSFDEYIGQVRAIIGVGQPVTRGITRVRSRISPSESQLYRCLAVLRGAGRALTTQEISKALDGAILHNNANKILKRHASLAIRREGASSNVRYEITSHGLAFLSAIERLS